MITMTMQIELQGSVFLMNVLNIVIFLMCSVIHMYCNSVHVGRGIPHKWSHIHEWICFTMKVFLTSSLTQIGCEREDKQCHRCEVYPAQLGEYCVMLCVHHLQNSTRLIKAVKSLILLGNKWAVGSEEGRTCVESSRAWQTRRQEQTERIVRIWGCCR